MRFQPQGVARAWAAAIALNQVRSRPGGAKHFAEFPFQLAGALFEVVLPVVRLTGAQGLGGAFVVARQFVAQRPVFGQELAEIGFGVVDGR